MAATWIEKFLARDSQVMERPMKADGIQMATMLLVVSMLKEYIEQSTLPTKPTEPEMPENLRELQRLGFTNTEQWKEHKQLMIEYEQHLKAYEQAVQYSHDIQQTVETYLYARRDYGEDTLLIRFDDFERLMDKYNLVCGPFDAYLGSVPLDKMADIDKVVGRTRGWMKPVYVNSLDVVSGYEIINHYDDIELPVYLRRFPFVPGGSGVFGKDFHGNKTWDFDLGYKLDIKKSTDLFICAPAKDMRQLERVSHATNYRDPFICAHTNYGILVFTRWGEEANDAIVRMYEQIGRMLGELEKKLHIHILRS